MGSSVCCGEAVGLTGSRVGCDVAPGEAVGVERIGVTFGVGLLANVGVLREGGVCSCVGVPRVGGGDWASAAGIGRATPNKAIPATPVATMNSLIAR